MNTHVFLLFIMFFFETLMFGRLDSDSFLTQWQLPTLTEGNRAVYLCSEFIVDGANTGSPSRGSPCFLLKEGPTWLGNLLPE